MSALALAFVVTIAGFSQEKPAISFDAILACVKAGNCRNMQLGAINWFDVVNISVIGFKDETGAYAVSVVRDGELSIWISAPGETRPGRVVVVGPEDTVLSAELGPLPGDAASPHQRSPSETAEWNVKHRAFLSPKNGMVLGGKAMEWGAEFRIYWEAQASQALAAIRRQISK